MASTADNLDRHPVAGEMSVEQQVPVIDISDLLIDSSSEAARASIDQIANACQDWGFFQVVNHGISDPLVTDTWAQTRLLFAMPEEGKLAVMRSKDNPWGFYNNELTKNQRDKKEVFDFCGEAVDSIYGQSNRWPDAQDDFKQVMTTYFDACTTLSLKLLEAFSLGLKLPAEFMHGDFAPQHTGFVRLNHYPIEDPMSGSSNDYRPEADLGIHHHTDAGALTVLMQDDVGGLQVYHEGCWHNVPPIPGAIVINTGDMMQVWSNDIYQAPIHRVLAMQARVRYSIPFFFNPAASSKVSPLPTVVSEANPSRYRDIEWARFRGARSDGDYADYGTEVQIAQFRR